MPKGSYDDEQSMVIHSLSALPAILEPFYNVALLARASLPIEMLFARFAWLIFRLLEQSFDDSIERASCRVDGKDNMGSCVSAGGRLRITISEGQLDMERTLTYQRNYWNAYVQEISRRMKRRPLVYVSTKMLEKALDDWQLGDGDLDLDSVRLMAFMPHTLDLSKEDLDLFLIAWCANKEVNPKDTSASNETESVNKSISLLSPVPETNDAEIYVYKAPYLP